MMQGSALDAVDAHMMPTYRRWPVEITSGRGCRLFDSHGRSYLDLVAGIAVASVGHAHPAVAAAIAHQASELVHVSNLYVTVPQARLAERLAGLTNGMQSFFANSGAEAIECAIKLARKWGRAGKGESAVRIVCAEGGFHGRTLGALAATGQPSKQAPFEPLPRGFTHVPYGDVTALNDAMADDVAAVLIEPVQGEAGVIVPPPGYLEGVRSICNHWGALLVLDEIQTGLGRTGRWFAHQHSTVTPDVMCLGKALAGGLPMSVCLAKPEVASTFVPGDHATTFGGGPVQAAAALAVLDVIESEFLVERSSSCGAELLDRLTAIAPSGARTRGLGLMAAVELAIPMARDVAAAALELGVLVNDATPNVVRLTPPLVIADDEIDEGLITLEKAFDAI
jgi:acetylornithine/N-succinyldiaminopimelate aminotransferase